MPGFTTLLTALGWSLLNSIWQLAVLWSVYSLLTAGIKPLSSAGKHNLALALSVIGTGWMISTFCQLLNQPAPPRYFGFIPVLHSVNYWIPYISLVYVFILTGRTVRYGYLWLDRNKNNKGKSVSTVLQSFVDRHARLLGIYKGVRVYLSDFAETAETSGFLKPLILLPASLITRLSPPQLEAILIHELFHIRRNDYLINIFISCFQSILFFNPFAQLFFRAISRERENACDDEVIERGYAPRLYAEALFCLEKFRHVQPGFSIAADGHKPWLLMERIQRVLGNPMHKKNRINPLLIFSLATSVSLISLQQKTTPAEPARPVTALRVSVLPKSYEMSEIGIVMPEKKTNAAYVPGRRLIKKQILPTPPQYSIGMEPAGAQDQVEKIIFAENNIPREYSNQQVTVLNEETVDQAPGTPYVPSVSLSYESAADLTVADSIRENAVQSRVMDLVIESRYRAAEKMKHLESVVAKSSQQLKRMEIKNQELILQHRRNIKPLLNNIQEQLKLNRQKIEQLKIQLQISDTEIIHI